MDRFKTRHFLYPFLSVAASVAILVGGLLLSNSWSVFVFLGGIWVLLLLLGYYRSCLAVLPIACAFAAAFGGLTYGISHDVQATSAAIARIVAVCVAVIPGMGLPEWALVNNLAAVRAPRMITLGMMIALSFFPLLKKEIRQIREAMRTRGAGSLLRPTLFYRALLIPLVMRIVNISDTLSLSVETRGFDVQSRDGNVYKKVGLHWRDFAFLAMFFAITAVSVYFC